MFFVGGISSFQLTIFLLKYTTD